MNLKIVISSLLILVSYLFSPQVNASQFTLGEHYIEVEGTQTKSPEVREFFSFYCPHCYRSEPLMQEVAKLVTKPSQFVKNHVDGMPGRKIEIEHFLTKALITADLLNVKSKMVGVIFSYIHQGKADFSTEKDIRNLFVLNGVEGEQFDKTFGSFKVNLAANQMRNKTAALRKQGITSVPTLIINGKYKPINNSVTSTKEYLFLIKFLLQKTA